MGVYEANEATLSWEASESLTEASERHHITPRQGAMECDSQLRVQGDKPETMISSADSEQKICRTHSAPNPPQAGMVEWESF